MVEAYLGKSKPVSQRAHQKPASPVQPAQPRAQPSEKNHQRSKQDGQISFKGSLIFGKKPASQPAGERAKSQPAQDSQPSHAPSLGSTAVFPCCYLGVGIYYGFNV